MADPDTPTPEPSDLDFDLDFDLGEIDFGESEDTETPTEDVGSDVLSRDLESLLGGSKGSNQPRAQAEPALEDEVPEPDPQPISDPEPDLVPTPEIEPEPQAEEDPIAEELPDLSEPDETEPEEIPEIEIDEEDATEIERTPATELDDEDLIDDELDELDLDEELEVELEEEPAEETPAPMEEPPAIEEEIPPSVDDLDAEIESQQEEETNPDEAGLSEAAQAAALRRQARKRLTKERESAPLEEDEFEVVFDDDSELSVPADVPGDLEPDLEDDLDDELASVFDDEPQIEVVAEAADTVPEEFEDNIEVDIEDIDEIDISREPELLAPDSDEQILAEQLEEITAELEDDTEVPSYIPRPLAREPITPPPAVEMPTAELESDHAADEFDDIEAELGEANDLEKVTDLTIDEGLELEDAVAVLSEADAVSDEAPAADGFDDEFDVEFDDDDDLGEAVASEVEDLEPELSPGIAGLVERVKDTSLEFDTVAEDDGTGVGFEDETSDPVEDEFEATIDDVAEVEGDQPSRGKLLAFKPLELAGIAAVVAVCLGGLMMLLSTVSGVIAEGKAGIEEISKDVPDSLSGELLTIGDLFCHWRDRTPTDRVREPTQIMPIVSLNEVSGSGHLQVLFRDAEGTIRGDGVILKVTNGTFAKGGSSALAVCTEGLANEAQFAYYRSESDLALQDRWSVSVRESADGEKWSDLATFEVPAKRL